MDRRPMGVSAAESVGLHRAAVTLQFREQIVLHLRDGRRARRMRAEADLLGDVGEGAFAVEAAGLVR